MASRVKRADLGHAFGSFGDDDELDDDQDEEDDAADDVSADGDVAEGLDDLAGEPVSEHEAGGGDVQPEPQQGRDQEQRREDREVEGLLDEHGRQQDDDTEDDVHGDQHVERPGGHRNDEQEDDADDPEGHGDHRQVLPHGYSYAAEPVRSWGSAGAAGAGRCRGRRRACGAS
ncbi:hypothetical protein ATY41_09875 [Leifsonia xyli subsp. xyli]|uniref:Uncharacterized protein n=1 Tax=Leifsonia xyli subsp. xyli TaxID=59736 RepID=A0A1E2SLE0_LEIXY|nr:hypothetical protein ATY41_09875 [Leifsonia xyli subsp. xyli]